MTETLGAQDEHPSFDRSMPGLGPGFMVTGYVDPMKDPLDELGALAETGSDLRMIDTVAV